MKNKYNIIIFHLILSFFTIILFSCEEEEIVDNTPDQLFRPVLFKANTFATYVEFSWAPIANATYLLELSKDSLLFQNELQFFTIDGEPELKVGNLSSGTLYSARIKAVSSDSSIKDSEYKELTFRTE